jgi:3-(3-hydroxy-phenyl)propionate hydroxylase
MEDARPIVIAGGGPVGLMLASLLARYRIHSIVVEADEGYCNGSRAICIGRRSLEILSWIGADRRIREIGLPWVGGRSYFRDIEVLHFFMQHEPGERFPPMINIQQYEIEEAVHRAAADGFVEVRWKTRVVDVLPRADGVRVALEDHRGHASSIDTDWLVGCDGGRSTVRSRLGLQLEGVEYEGRYVIVDIEQATSRDVERLAWFDPPSNPGSTILMHRQPGDVWRIDFQLHDDEDPAEAIAPANVLPRIQSHLTMIGETAPWKPLWISIYNAKCLTLGDYRAGRVLFAGDAAHLVPIFGVRGLNSGLDDAGNLGWKLAAVVDGRAPAGLLTSYTTERLHAARENIAYGAKSTEFMAPPHAGFRLMRDAALRLAIDDDRVRSLVNPRQTFPSTYPESPLHRGDGPLVGRAAPDWPIAARFAEHLSELFGNRFVLLLFGVRFEGAPLDELDVYTFVREGADGGTTSVDREGAVHARYGVTTTSAVLVRPDGYVMAQWPTFDREQVRDALDAVFAMAHAHEP